MIDEMDFKVVTAWLNQRSFGSQSLSMGIEVKEYEKDKKFYLEIYSHDKLVWANSGSSGQQDARNYFFNFMFEWFIASYSKYKEDKKNAGGN